MSEAKKSEQPKPTERFHRVLAFASDEADGLGHGFITCQHLLYALSRESKGLASAALDSLGVSPGQLHELIVETSAPHDRVEGRIDLSDEVRDAIERAAAAANLWGHRWLDTEHLLYGIANSPTSADEMFAALHIPHSAVIERLTTLQRTAPPTPIREEAAHAYRFALESAWLLSLATDSARQASASTINSLHLLLALIALDGPVQHVLVEDLGIQNESIIRRIRYGAGAAQGQTRLLLEEDVQRILGCAIGEAWNRGHLAVTPLHIAMGLARSDLNAALDVLAELGVSQAELLDALARVMPPSTAR